MRRLWFAFVLLAFVGINSASAGVPATPKNDSLRYTSANRTQSRQVAFWRKKKRKKACYCCKKKFNHNKKFRHCFYDCHCNNGKMTCKMRTFCKLMLDYNSAAHKGLQTAKTYTSQAEKAKKSAEYYQEALEREQRVSQGLLQTSLRTKQEDPSFQSCRLQLATPESRQRNQENQVAPEEGQVLPGTMWIQNMPTPLLWWEEHLPSDPGVDVRCRQV